jgi:hypothetical protein
VEPLAQEHYCGVLLSVGKPATRVVFSHFKEMEIL